MKPHHLILVLMAGWIVSIPAAPTSATVPDEARLAEVLALPSEFSFTNRFCHLLLDVPASAFPAWRDQLDSRLAATTLPPGRRDRALGLADQRWVDVDEATFRAACRANPQAFTFEGKTLAVRNAMASGIEGAIRLFHDLGLDAWGQPFPDDNSALTRFFLDACQGDWKQAESMLRSLPDGPRRESLLKQWEIMAIDEAPDRLALDTLLARADRDPAAANDPGGGIPMAGCSTAPFDPVSDAEVLMGRDDPEVDTLLASLPQTRVGQRNRLQALRGCHFAKRGHFDRALALWRNNPDSAAVCHAINQYAGMETKVGVPPWPALLEIATSRSKAGDPPIPVLNELLPMLAGRVASLDLAHAAVVALGDSDPEVVRLAFLEVIPGLPLTPRDREAGFRKIESLPFNDRTARVRCAWWLTAVATDPLGAWKQAVRLGIDRPEGGKLGWAAIREVSRRNPCQALVLLGGVRPVPVLRQFVVVIESLGDPETNFLIARLFSSQASFETLSIRVWEWAKVDPARACTACLDVEEPWTQQNLLDRALTTWCQTDPKKAEAWVRGLTNPAHQKVGLSSLIGVLSADHADRAAALCRDFPWDPKWKSSVAGIIERWARSDLRGACRFGADFSDRVSPDTFCGVWQGALINWFQFDPGSAADFLVSLKLPPGGQGLTTGLRGRLLLQFGPALPTWKESVDPGTPWSIDDAFADTGGDFNKAVAKVQAMEPGSTRNNLLIALIDFLQGRGQLDAARPLEDALFASVTAPEKQYYEFRTKEIFGYPLDNDPASMLGHAEWVAQRHPDWLYHFVRMMLEKRLDRAPYRGDVLRSVLLMPESQRVFLIEILDPEKKNGLGLRNERADLMVGPESDPGGLNALLRAVGEALVDDNLPGALQAAAGLPSPEYNALLCRILSAFPSPTAARIAVRGLRSPELRKRCQDWIPAVFPQDQGG